ncbi:hypothetical protein PAESOLCIP111_06386 [Paenibacillus solanacearum]|uniref:HTH tetR-type domain-containing protein n=1 Tax=Paenibacillus solanacearum TaxID=2048548 RepID=A0A916K7V2_9BACL|nr:TetR/AcrR family transcriptional regulator [Paenibacillus solanacearum]CAG7651769.1 hypothetical protein PAESOLCIP111_06386 [Paenibacillus solanacearum]
MKSKEKLQAAAAKLFMEKGYENTTVQEIADLAGVTERTFFRQFKNKPDVLFDTNNEMGQQVAAFITNNFDIGKKPLKLAVDGFVSISGFFDNSRERVLARNQIIQNNPDLQERELLKGQLLIASVANSLCAQYDSDLSELAARFAVEIFHMAFIKWINSAEKSLAEQLLNVYDLYVNSICSVD